MRNLMYRSLVSMLALTVGMSSIVYADTNINANGGCDIRSEGFTPGTTVTYSIGGTQLGGAGNVSNQGVAIRTIGKRDLEPGANNVVIRSSNGITKSETCFVREGSTGGGGGGSTGGGGGTTNPPPPPPPPA